jgi:hypothetical protein
MQNRFSMYAPPDVWGPWFDLFTPLFGYQGQVSFSADPAGATEVLYQVQCSPTVGGGTVIQDAMPGVPFFTIERAQIRARGLPFGSQVTIDVEY